MKAITEYSIKQALINQRYIMGGIMILASFVLFGIFGRITLMPFIFGILFIIIGAQQSKGKIIKIYDTHLEINLGFSQKRIKNEQFNDVKVEKNKIIITHTLDNGESSETKIIKNILEEEDYNELIVFLKNRLY